jgi:dihydroorotase
VGLETAVPLVLDLVRQGEITPEDMVRMMACTPSEILGLPVASFHHAGNADITVIDPDAEWMVEPDVFCSKGHNSPFLGKKLKGRAVMTVVDGCIVNDNQTFMSAGRA